MAIVKAGALLLLSLALGCAPGRRAGPDPCDDAAEHADGVLRRGLETVLSRTREFAAARDPGASTAAAEARAWERADEWSAARLPAVAAACHGWPEATRRCVLAAADPHALNACGLEELVKSFTDGVVGEFAASPLR